MLTTAESKRTAFSLRGLLQIADPKIWIASTVPMLCGIALGIVKAGRADVFWILLSMLCVYLVETGKNAANECLDFITGVDRFVDAAHRTPFSGGKKTIVDGVLTLNACFAIALVTFTLAAALGLVIALLYNPAVLWIGFAGILLAALYSLPPFKLCYRGLGEVAVGLAFGPVIVCGMYVLIAREISLLPLLVSLPLGFLIANVLWINQFPDYEADKAGGKRNGVVRLGKKRSRAVYALLFALAYACFLPVAFAARSAVWLLPLLSVPLAVRAIRNCYKNYDDIPKLIASNAATVQIYQLTGALIVVCAILDRLVFQ